MLQPSEGRHIHFLQWINVLQRHLLQAFQTKHLLQRHFQASPVSCSEILPGADILELNRPKRRCDEGVVVGHEIIVHSYAIAYEMKIFHSGKRVEYIVEVVVEGVIGREAQSQTSDVGAEVGIGRQ